MHFNVFIDHGFVTYFLNFFLDKNLNIKLFFRRKKFKIIGETIFYKSKMRVEPSPHLSPNVKERIGRGYVKFSLGFYLVLQSCNFEKLSHVFRGRILENCLCFCVENVFKIRRQIANLSSKSYCAQLFSLFFYRRIKRW